ncbi:MAG: hypothetical protein E6P95_00195 [Candidatus Moraniibacteriota bacterium]|nr:MAG: hypothetical protein E6P95_00195 [Candidatus Moranbacteria bacterium]
MMVVYDELEPYGRDSKPEWVLPRDILAKYGDAMLEVIRLTGENIQLNKEVTRLQLEVARLQRILNYLLNTQARGG